jgi:hypothetical protein
MATIGAAARHYERQGRRRGTILPRPPGFVTKPFDPVALVALLSGVIERTTAA